MKRNVSAKYNWLPSREKLNTIISYFERKRWQARKLAAAIGLAYLGS